MPDVFLSYASQDRETARALAAALGDRGWSVFWDRTIPPGREFDVVIGEALQAARCVVVLWSTASVGSRWVKEEAEDAATRNILVPAVLDDVSPPLGFRRLQAARLAGWPADTRATHEFEQLLTSIAKFVGATPPRPTPHSGHAPQKPPRVAAETGSVRRREASVAVLWIAGLLGAGVGYWSVNYNSDVGIVAALPFWVIGGGLGLWLRFRR
jgi:hypothetical protein